MRRFVPMLVLALLPAAAAAQQPRVRAEFPPPSLRIGEFRADLRVRLHFDWRDFNPELGEDLDEFQFRRARVAVEGRLYDDLEYEVDADFRDHEHPFRDVYVNYRRFSAAEIQVGRFKMPFGLDQNTGVFNLNFIERSLIGSQLSPARDRGVMVHGQVAGDRFAYQIGYFGRDGDSTRFAGRAVDGTWAGRVELTPWENVEGPFNSAQFGVNATSGTLLEGLFGLRGRTLSGADFAEEYYVKGTRLRLGADARWTPGPVSIQAEYIRVTDERNGQGLGDVDLPNAVAQGWYVAGAWVLTGENKGSGVVDPDNPFLTEGIGAIELVARIERMRFTSAGTGGEPPFSNPRAANILPNSDRILTLGLNWYVNRFGRVMVNGTREDLEDPLRSPLSGRTRFWGAVMRLQFVM